MKKIEMKTGLKVIVYEPNAIALMGVSLILASLGISESKVNSYNGFANIIDSSFNADVIYTSTGTYNDNATEVLHFLLNKNESENRTPVIVYQGTENSALKNLLLAFGANIVLPPDVSEQALNQSLVNLFYNKKPHEYMSLLTWRECLVIYKLMLGYSLTEIAAQTGRDVRTVSTQKRNAIAKLQMASGSDLQILAGQLNYESR